MLDEWISRRVQISLLVIFFCITGGATVVADESAELEFFETRIRPVLVQHCYECHSAASDPAEGEFRLDWSEGLLAGGESGEAIVPGQASESLLISALRHESIEMPPDEKLDDSIIADFVRWIDQGAFDPRDEAPSAAAANELAWEAKLAERRQWWSLLPVERPKVPEVRDTEWSTHEVDRFILAKLEKKELCPAPQAERSTLIRRLSFALTGLPPTVEELQNFLADDSSEAWETLVDRLLASPHFGERFARHWMDVVRYSDTYGYEWDVPAKGAWRYRDYLIRAFNTDLPFDQLVREHLAGDLIDSPRINPDEEINESLIGLMHYQMGEKRHGDSADFNGVHQEMLDDKINTFSKAFQAITITCARCHDHKLDAVSQKEYYAVAGVFFSSRWATNTLDTADRNESVLGELRALKSQLRHLLAATWLEEIEGLSDAMLIANGKPPEGEQTNVWSAVPADSEKPAPALEDLQYPWQQLAKASSEATNLSDVWNELATQYETESSSRSKHNAENYTVLADFRDAIPEGWSVDGVGLRESTPCGDFTVALEGSTAVGRVLPGGLFTYALSPRLNGVIRTAVLSGYSQSQISFEHSAGDYSAVRTIVDNAFLTERQQYLDSPKTSWKVHSTYPQYRSRKVILEIATKTSNPNFPPRMGLGKELTAEEIRDPKSWFGISRVLLHNEPAAPKDELTRFAPLFASGQPQSLAEAAEQYENWFRQSLEAWAQDKADEQDVRLINWLLDHQLLANRNASDENTEIGRLVEQYRQAELRIKIPQTINGMVETGQGGDYPLNIRGDFDQESEQVPRGYLRALTDSKAGFEVEGSGRLELANLVASPTNPLTSRVIVNRVWYWLFGRGIVATPNNFGKLGQPPSHPELLDFLASQFVEQGWSIKQLVRSLVLTEAWRQGLQPTDLAQQVDPRNLLVHHYGLHRLEAEAVRDSMLVVSGQIDPQLYGLPIDPPRMNEDPQKRLVAGPLDGERRRSIYTKITIMEPPQFLAIFNQPQPKIPTGKRDVSNTPLQSLTLLNDPFVTSQAGHWADALLAQESPSIEERLTQMFLHAFSRAPASAELDRWSTAVQQLGELHNITPGEELTSLVVWKDIAHTMFNMKEFIYVK